jgi:hypothetical protein
MLTTTTTPPRLPFGLLYGLINAGVSIIFTVILYLIGVDAFVSPLAWLSFVIPIVVCVLGGLHRRRFQGGYLEFAEALKTTFGILVIGAAIATLFNFILLNFVDVPFREALTQAAADKVEQMMSSFGLPQGEIDKAVEKTMSGENYKPGQQLLGFAFGCILWFLIALIVSAIIKKKRPPFENSFNQ